MASISLVIATRDLSRRLDPLDRFEGRDCEIIVVEGNNPSRQRNRGAKLASGDVLYFLDEDVMLPPSTLGRARKAFENDSSLAALGGPNLTPARDSFLQKIFGAALGSGWGTGKSQARYAPVGKRREAGEKELILSNLLVRADVFESTKGFHESLYPNEENELLDRVKTGKWRVVYDPALFVLKSQRNSFGAFSRQLFGYGKGRARQLALFPSWKGLFHTLPALFLTYLLFLSFAPVPLLALPLIAYAGLTAIFSLSSATSLRNPFAFPFLLVAFPLLHLSYGLGFVIGSLSLLQKRPVVMTEPGRKVTLQKENLPLEEKGSSKKTF